MAVYQFHPATCDGFYPNEGLEFIWNDGVRANPSIIGSGSDLPNQYHKTVGS